MRGKEIIVKKTCTDRGVRRERNKGKEGKEKMKTGVRRYEGDT